MRQRKDSFLTFGNYEKLVRRLQEVYRFISFYEGREIGEVNGGGPFVIMRHDIDMALEPAQRMSTLEKELGIQSTYFFMVRCPLYNVFSGVGSEIVKQILADGHHFGLHFDCSLYPDVSATNINYYVSKECSLLEEFFGHAIEAVSFHRPGRLELSGVETGRRPNSYEKVFLENFEYFSDSRGNWARGNPVESEAFTKRRNLHILVHPEWWSLMPVTPHKSLVNVVESIKRGSEHYIAMNCSVWNKESAGGKSA